MLAKQVRHIPSLDGIRAVSFLIVFMSHVGLERYVPGGFGVTIFFFLSGFLITTLMRSEFDKNARINFQHFWLRRVLRIFPAFYAVLLAATLGNWLLRFPDGVSLISVTAQALHYSNYWIIEHGYAGLPAGTGVYWSLAVEEHFYLLFPWFYQWMRSRNTTPRTQAMQFWSLCLLVLLWRCVLVFICHASDNRTYLATDTRVDSILFGCALAVWCNPVLDDTALDEKRWKYWYAPAAVAILVTCLLLRGEQFRETVRYSLQGAALSVFFIAAIRFPHWAPFRLLNSRVMGYLGLLSYALYLVHYFIIAAVNLSLPSVPPLIRGPLALCLSIAVAWMIYVGIEKPCARVRKRLSD